MFKQQNFNPDFQRVNSFDNNFMQNKNYAGQQKQFYNAQRAGQFNRQKQGGTASTQDQKSMSPNAEKGMNSQNMNDPDFMKFLQMIAMSKQVPMGQQPPPQNKNNVNNYINKNYFVVINHCGTREGNNNFDMPNWQMPNQNQAAGSD